MGHAAREEARRKAAQTSGNPTFYGSFRHEKGRAIPLPTGSPARGREPGPTETSNSSVPRPRLLVIVHHKEARYAAPFSYSPCDDLPQVDGSRPQTHRFPHRRPAGHRLLRLVLLALARTSAPASWPGRSCSARSIGKGSTAKLARDPSIGESSETSRPDRRGGTGHPARRCASTAFASPR
jgi:hypothetical protein